MRLVLVLLAACSSGTPRDRTPQPVVTDAAPDAAPDATIDAAVTAPPHAAVAVITVRCRDVNGPSPRFPTCIADPPAVEPPPPIVLGIKRRGAVTDRGVHVVVDGGTRRGIDLRWRVELLDAAHRPLRGGRASFVRLDPDELEVIVRVTADEVDTLAKSVRFSPPPP